ncbi:MAG: hypothetical protein ACI9KE_005884, partial [Polyangiales bacterium]
MPPALCLFCAPQSLNITLLGGLDLDAANRGFNRLDLR